MYYIIFIVCIALFSIVLLFKRSHDEKKLESVSFEETRPKPEFRVLEVMDMTDEKVQATIQFLQEISDKPSDFPTPKIERSDNTVRLMLDAKIGLYDFATCVNNFIFSDEAGKRYNVMGQYPIATATLDNKEINNTFLTFYTPTTLDEEDVQCAFFRTYDGKKYRYDLGFHRIDHTEKE